jgi:hypothetical protein
MPTFLAQQESTDPTQAIVWSAVLLVILMVLFLAIQRYRRWMSSEDTPTGAGFTLSDLRRLHKEGKMTDQEFETTKAIMVGKAKAASAGDKPVLGPRNSRADSDTPEGGDQG